MTEQDKQNARTSDKEFIKVYRRFMIELSNLGMENSGALSVFLFLCRNMDGTNAISMSMETIAGFVKMSRQTVSKHLKYLESNGWIQKFKTSGGVFYVINDAVAWTSYGTQHEMCKFNATIILEREMAADDPWDAKKNKATTVHPRKISMEAVQDYPAEDNLPGQITLNDLMEGMD